MRSPISARFGTGQIRHQPVKSHARQGGVQSRQSTLRAARTAVLRSRALDLFFLGVRSIAGSIGSASRTAARIAGPSEAGSAAANVDAAVPSGIWLAGSSMVGGGASRTPVYRASRSRPTMITSAGLAVGADPLKRTVRPIGLALPKNFLAKAAFRSRPCCGAVIARIEPAPHQQGDVEGGGEIRAIP